MEVLSLKWNNHQTVFSHQICELRRKTIYADATLACHGRFYQVHRLVLSTCSEYFSSIFNQTSCPNPVIVLKDMACKDLEFLLDYMYAGEVSVRQIELPSLISAAESLQIKGLAISDDTYSNLNKHETKSYSNKEVTKKSSPDNSHDTMFESDCNKRSIQKLSNIGNSVHQTTNSAHNKNTLLSHKDINDHSLANSDNFPNFKVSDTGTTVIKAEPELVPCDYESPISDEAPFTSHSKENLSSNDEAANSFQHIPNGIKFTDETSNICAPTELQEDSSNLLPIESPKMLPQDPFLQLPAPRVMGRSSQMKGFNHIEIANTVKRDYICSFCGRVFSHRTNQLAHERIHTGEKPFQCLYCPFRTALKGNLKNHIFTRHSGDWKSIKHLIFPSKES